MLLLKQTELPTILLEGQGEQEGWLSPTERASAG